MVGDKHRLSYFNPNWLLLLLRFLQLGLLQACLHFTLSLLENREQVFVNLILTFYEEH